MNKISLTLVLSLFLSVAYGQDFKSYLPMKEQKNLNDTNFTAPEVIEQMKKKSEESIHEMDKNWKKPEPIYEVKPSPFRLEQFSEGTGTRGGGSGVLVRKSDSLIEVKLLEIYRSENLELYNQFFPVDPQLWAMEKQGSSDQAAKAIFDTVLARVRQVSPKLGQKIYEIYAGDLSLDKWVPIYHDLPMVEDEVVHPLEKNNQKVQIATRRTQSIMYNTRAYSAMSPLNRAALWMHEYIYALSGNELSLKTQRAVSLFFSSEFLKISEDEVRIANLFYEMDLLGLARSVDRSLPAGSKIASVKQEKKCYPVLGLKTDIDKRVMNFFIEVDGARHSMPLKVDAPETKVIVNVLFWAKIHLKTDYPLYKYPAQKIMPDKICFNLFSTRVTQMQMSVAIDEELAESVKAEARAEVELEKAKSVYYRLRDSDPKSFSERIRELNKIQSLTLDLFSNQSDRLAKSLTFATPNKLINPKILGEYNIDLEY
jgi:hypothetical protein